MKIVISGDYGEPGASKCLWPIQKRLNEIFEKKMAGDYATNVKELSVVLRVSGEIKDFGAEGAERLRVLKGGSEITIDLVIPRDSWCGKSEEVLKGMVVDRIGMSLRKMIFHIQKKNGLIDDGKLNADIERAISCLGDIC
ncbi:hypothetical protein [Serratia ureilytica]|uniref:hypothetical protein n=1 Tax=Serratia ureilytica TaxID=300181 RepID=UPI001D17E904|nr:hypothetical protein [Serratia ureilytica]MCC4104748.1 hypothetical protein [Serratia ureilytica]